MIWFFCFLAPFSHDSGLKESEPVRAALESFRTALESRDVNQVMTSFWSGDELSVFLPTPYTPLQIQGSENTRKALDIFFGGLPKRSVLMVTFHQPVIQMEGNNALILTQQNFYLNTSGLPKKLISRTTILMRKQSGQWKIVHFHGAGMPEASDFLPE